MKHIKALGLLTVLFVALAFSQAKAQLPPPPPRPPHPPGAPGLPPPPPHPRIHIGVHASGGVVVHHRYRHRHYYRRRHRHHY